MFRAPDEHRPVSVAGEGVGGEQPRLDKRAEEPAIPGCQVAVDDRGRGLAAEDFPQALIPGECGLIVADAFGAAILRESPVAAVPAARRKSVILRFALLGSDRLRRLLDPAAGDAELF